MKNNINNNSKDLPKSLHQFLKQTFDNKEFIKLPIDLFYALNGEFEEDVLLMVPQKVQDILKKRKYNDDGDYTDLMKENFLYNTEYLYIFPEKYVYMDKTLGEYGIYNEDLYNFYINEYQDYPFIYINIGGYIAIADFNNNFERYLNEK